MEDQRESAEKFKQPQTLSAEFKKMKEEQVEATEGGVESSPPKYGGDVVDADVKEMNEKVDELEREIVKLKKEKEVAMAAVRKDLESQLIKLTVEKEVALKEIFERKEINITDRKEIEIQQRKLNNMTREL